MTALYFAALPDSFVELQREIQDCWPQAEVREEYPGILSAKLNGQQTDIAPILAFSTQALGCLKILPAGSNSETAKLIFSFIQEHQTEISSTPAFHIFDSAFIGRHEQPRRVSLIAEALDELLSKKLRSVRRGLHQICDVWNADETLIQVVLVDKTAVLISLLHGDRKKLLRHCLSPFAAGSPAVPDDKYPPSRAYKKLLEAELCLGKSILKNSVCVDLGASPGGWSAIALQREAKVIAVDRSPLREDLMRDRNLIFIQGDGFSHTPKEPVDWLLCDIIAYPQRNLALLESWLKNHWCKNFVVTLKFKGEVDFQIIAQAKSLLQSQSDRFIVRCLLSNKNEVCLAGTVRE